MKRFVLYHIRWQGSTPILWLVTLIVAYLLRDALAPWAVFLAGAIAANLIGATIFFPVDRAIMRSR